MPPTRAKTAKRSKPQKKTADRRKIMLTLKGGKKVARIDYIRQQWKKGLARSAIRADVEKLGRKPVSYQIVFNATKGMAGGPKKPAKRVMAKKAPVKMARRGRPPMKGRARKTKESKYDGLRRHLVAQRGDNVPMTFAAIEKAIGFKLPASARRHRPWWSNNPNNSTITHSWLDAGFYSAQVDMNGSKLVFKRGKKPTRGGARKSQAAPRGRVGRPRGRPAAPRAATPRAPAHRATGYGALRDFITIASGVDLTAASGRARAVRGKGR